MIGPNQPADKMYEDYIDNELRAGNYEMRLNVVRGNAVPLLALLNKYRQKGWVVEAGIRKVSTTLFGPFDC